MKLKITVDLDNAAFRDPGHGPQWEVARILGTFANYIIDHPLEGVGDSGHLPPDINGNKVGEWKVTR